MKISSAGQGLSRAAARNCALINQLATPGLGSLMGGRYVAGTGQLLMALIGFGFVLAWFVSLVRQVYRQIDTDTPGPSVAWLGEIGGVIFAAAWAWSLVTSLALLRRANRDEPGPASSA
jgi:membrane associated rhomboid family serine protease